VNVVFYRYRSLIAELLGIKKITFKAQMRIAQLQSHKVTFKTTPERVILLSSKQAVT